MNNYVAAFIENNIELIEEPKKWLLLFFEYYHYPKTFPDTEVYEELIKVLNSVVPKFEEKTLNIRRAVIITELRGEINKIQQYIDEWKPGNFIPEEYLRTCLDTVLGLNKHEISQCIKEAAKYESLTPHYVDGLLDGFTWE